MKDMLRVVVGLSLAAVLTTAGPAAAGAPAGSPQLGSIIKHAQQARELTITEADEIRIGEAVSEKVRIRYRVVQDAAVHRYVSLVGMVLAQATNRPRLPWTFIVLDTDGVNAFAAPGGYVHITRGALGLIANEAELAGVLAHEVTHVTEKHTIKAIQKGKMIQVGADETLKDSKVFSSLVDKTTDLVMAGFGRAEELEADHGGIRLANSVGYAPGGLAAFLTRLSDRNKSATEKQGLFASHPEMQERLDKLSAIVSAEKLTATATDADRYHKFITYKAKPQTEITAVAAGSAGLASGSSSSSKDADKDKKDDQPKKHGFGLGSLVKPSGSSDKKSAEVTGSGASRGVDTERNAKGGPVSKLVVVTITPGDLDTFKKEGKLK